MKSLLPSVLGCLLIAAFPAMVNQAWGQCGPGEHWIQQCEAGQATWDDVSAEVGIDINLDCEPDMFVTVSGWVTVQWSDPMDDSQNFPGTRPVDGYMDVIDTEIISMELTGSDATVIAGEGQGEGGVLPASPGVIAEVDDGEYMTGDSRFHLYGEAEMIGMFLYNHDPIVIQALIIQIPPYGSIYTFEGCIPVYDSPEPGEGNHLGNIVAVELTVPMSQEVPTLSEWGMIILVLLLLAVGTVAVVRRRKAAVSKAT